MLVDFFKRRSWNSILFSLDSSQFFVIFFNDVCSFMEKCWHASDNGLWVEIAIELFEKPALKLKRKSITSSVFRYLNLLAIAAATNWIWTSLASSFNPQETLTSAICGTSQIADANIPYVISSNLKHGESPIKH